MTILYARHGMTTGFFTPQYRRVLEFGADNSYTLPDLSVQIEDNARIKKMINLGIWESEDIMYWMSRGSREFSCINYKNPGTFNLTQIGTPSWSLGGGFVGSGSTSHMLNTNWAPSQGVQFTTDRQCCTMKSTTPNSQSNLYSFGIVDNTSPIRHLLFRQRSTLDQAGGAACGSFFSNLVTSVTDSRGTWHFGREGNGDRLFVIRNGTTLLAPGSVGSGSSRSTLKLYLCGHNNDGANGSGATRNMTYFAAGTTKTPDQIANYHLILP